MVSSPQLQPAAQRPHRMQSPTVGYPPPTAVKEVAAQSFRRVSCLPGVASNVQFMFSVSVTGFTPQFNRLPAATPPAAQNLATGHTLGYLPAKRSAPAVLLHGSPAGSGASGGLGLLLGFLTGPLPRLPQNVVLLISIRVYLLCACPQ